MGDEISGNYVFGDQPPFHLMGWLGIYLERFVLDKLKKAGRVVLYKDVKHLMRSASPTAGNKHDHVWDLERKLFGRLLPTELQQANDCAAVSLKGAGQKQQVIEIAQEHQNEKYREWFAPWIYALSRNQIGGGISSTGSTGAWAVAAIAKYGVLFADDAGVPPYSGTLANAWGSERNVVLDRAPYRKFLPVAKDNGVKIVRVKSVEEMHEMIRVHRRMMTIASTRGFRMKPVKYRGHHVFQPYGSWMHQMHIIAEMTEPFSALYRMNQWGADAHGTPLNGESPGGAWNLDEHLEEELEKEDIEVWAIYDFSGDPKNVNHDNLIRK